MMEKVNRDKATSNWDVFISEPRSGESKRVTPIQILLSGDFAFYALVQMFYAFTYVSCITLLPERFTLNAWLTMCAYFISPIIIRLGMMYHSLENPSYNTLITTNALSVLIPSLEVATICVSNIAWSVWNVPLWYRTYRFMLQNFGINSILENAWVQFQVPNVLRTFWLVRFTVHVVQIILAFESKAVLPGIMDSSAITNESHFHREVNPHANLAWTAVLEVTTHGCDSTLAVLGLTAVVSYLVLLSG